MTTNQATSTVSESRVNSFLAQVYLLMAIGLVIPLW